MKWAPGASEGVNIISVSVVPGEFMLWIQILFMFQVIIITQFIKYTYADQVWTQSTVAGGNGRGTELNKLDYPTGVHVDSAGNVYVADRQITTEL